MAHPERINPDETAFESGEDTSYLRYDSLENFLSGMAMGLIEQAEADEMKNRPILAKLGRETADKIDEAVKIVAKMWQISEPHMKVEDKL